MPPQNERFDKLIILNCKYLRNSKPGEAFSELSLLLKDRSSRNFLGSLVVKTLPSNAGGRGLIHGQGAKIPHALGPKNQNIKDKNKTRRNTVTKSIKTFKNTSQGSLVVVGCPLLFQSPGSRYAGSSWTRNRTHVSCIER